MKPNIEIISASAGTGKTYALASCLEHAVISEGVRPEAVIATTFTTKAAGELRERVSARVYEKGHPELAQRLNAARMGTVNSVCGRWVNDFAFELGLAPDLGVLDETAQKMRLGEAISRVLTDEHISILDDLGTRIEDLNWRETVETLVQHARSNGICAEDLLASKERSVESWNSITPEPSTNPDQELVDPLLEAVDYLMENGVAAGDDTKGSREARDMVAQYATRLKTGRLLTWTSYRKLSNVKFCKPSESIFLPIQNAALAMDRHPQFRADGSQLIDVVYKIAAGTLDSYQKYKRELRVIDFVDQETLALQLLREEKIRDRLKEEIELVIVDEFQDTSPLQLAIFLELAKISPRNVWVGDQKQAIHGFRGSDPALMNAVIASVLSGDEPQTLGHSYRSRPALVDLCSGLFAEPFSGQGIPEARVRISSKCDEVPGLGAIVEHWHLQTSKRSLLSECLCIANGVSDLLTTLPSILDGDRKGLAERAPIRVRDRLTGHSRPVRPSDIAVLMRKNANCHLIADVLEAIGIHAVVPRAGVLSTLEGRLTRAGLRLAADSSDLLARAEIARITRYGESPNDWLKELMVERADTIGVDGEKLPFDESKLPFREGFSFEIRQCSGALDVFEQVLQVLEIPEWCRKWGNSEARLSNLEAIRSQVVQFCEGVGNPLGLGSPAHLVAWLDQTADAKLDHQAAKKNEDAVVVSTWHGSKGLEWPIVVLGELKYDRGPDALGCSVESDRTSFVLEDPLGGRWLRFLPNFYGKDLPRKGAFSAKLMKSPETASAEAKQDKESLRLLYVAMTRARDVLVLASTTCEFGASPILSLLRDSEGKQHIAPVSKNAGPEERVSWAGYTFLLGKRSLKDTLPDSFPTRAGTGFRLPQSRVYPPARMSPSRLEGVGPVLKTILLGQRIVITGDGEMDVLGNAIHDYFAVDTTGDSERQRLELAAQILNNWGVSDRLRPAQILEIHSRLVRFVETNWPGAVWHTEYPVAYRRDDGSIVGGSCDLALETVSGWVVVDHKSYPGKLADLKTRAGKYADQLSAYSTALRLATGKPILGQWIHFPISSVMMQVGEVGQVASAEVDEAPREVEAAETVVVQTTEATNEQTDSRLNQPRYSLKGPREMDYVQYSLQLDTDYRRDCGRFETDCPWGAGFALKINDKSREYRIGERAHPESRIIDWRHPLTEAYFQTSVGDIFELDCKDFAIFEGAVERKIKVGGKGRALQRVEVIDVSGGTVVVASDDSFSIETDYSKPKEAETGLPDIRYLLSPQQYRLITASRKNPVILQGRAGSGKTTVAMYRVSWLTYTDETSSEPPVDPSKVLIVMFNKALNTFVKQSLGALNLGAVQIDTFHGWAKDQLELAYGGKVEMDTVKREGRDTASGIKKQIGILRVVDEYVAGQTKSLEAWLEERLTPYRAQSLVADLRGSALPVVRKLAALRVKAAKAKTLAQGREQQRMEQVHAVLVQAAKRMTKYKEELLQLLTNKERLRRHLPNVP